MALEPRARASNAAALLLALGSGVLHVAASPIVGVWPLAFVALVPLFVAIAGRAPAEAAWLGWVCGLVATSVGFAWLPSALLGFSKLTPYAAFAIWTALSAYQALRWAVLGWIQAKISRNGWPNVPAALCAHTAAEALVPLAFPWYFGSALHDVRVLNQVAELGGASAVSAVAVLGNLVITLLIRGPLGLAAGGESRTTRAWAAASASLLLVAWSYGGLRILQVEAAELAAPLLKIGIVQPNLAPLEKRALASALSVRSTLTRELVARESPDLVLWSESAVPNGFSPANVREQLEAQVSRRLKVPVLFGAVVAASMPSTTEGGTQYNSAFLAARDGSICESCRYDKQMLLPWGEFLPGERWLPQLRAWFPNTGQFAPGPRERALGFGTHEIAVSICLEDLEASHVSHAVAMDEAQLLVSLVDDAWFPGEQARRWHFVLSKLRAIEQRRFLVRATNTGVSAIVDSTGKVVARAPAGEAALLSGNVRWLSGRTVYSYVGNAFSWLLSGVAFTLALLNRSTVRRWRAP